MFDSPLPEIEDKITHALPPLPPIFAQPPAVEKTNAIAAGIASVQGEVAKFDQIAAGLAAIEAAHPKNVIVAAIDTPPGMQAAQHAWRSYRNPRLEVERARKAAKAPVLALGKAIDTFAGGLEDRLREGEDHYKAQIDAEEARKAAIKAEQERLEREAAERHAARLSAIAMYALRCQEPGMTAERIAAGMQRLEAADMTDPDNARAVDLADLQCRTLETMRTLHAQAVAREQEAARQEAIRQENERVAAELAAERQRIDAEAAEIRRQAAALDAQRAESERLERLAVANRERLAQDAKELAATRATVTVPDEAEETARIGTLAREAQIHAAGAQAMQAEAQLIDSAPTPPAEPEQAQPDEPADVTMGALANALGFRLTEEFVRDTLGVTPAKRDGRAVQFTNTQRRAILNALVRHVQGLL